MNTFKVYDTKTQTIYSFCFNDGRLQKLTVNNDVTYEYHVIPCEGQVQLSHAIFEKAFRVLCHDNFADIGNFMRLLKQTPEYYNIAHPIVFHLIGTLLSHAEKLYKAL